MVILARYFTQSFHNFPRMRAFFKQFSLQVKVRENSSKVESSLHYLGVGTARVEAVISFGVKLLCLFAISIFFHLIIPSIEKNS